MASCQGSFHSVLLHDGVLSCLCYPSVTPTSAVSSLQGTEHASSSRSVYLQERQTSGSLCGPGLNLFLHPSASERTTAPAWPPTQSAIFLLRLPKGHINNESLHLHTHTHTRGQTTLQASWQPSPSPPHGNIAGVLRRRTAERAHEFTENGTLSTI